MRSQTDECGVEAAKFGMGLPGGIVFGTDIKEKGVIKKDQVGDRGR